MSRDPDKLIDLRDDERDEDENEEPHYGTEPEIKRIERCLNRLDPFDPRQRRELLSTLVEMAARTNGSHVPVVAENGDIHFLCAADSSQPNNVIPTDAFTRTALFLLRLLEDEAHQFK